VTLPRASTQEIKHIWEFCNHHLRWLQHHYQARIDRFGHLQRHCMGIFNGMRVGGGSSEADVFARWLLHDQPAKFEDQPIV
jgi:cellulose synthase/poly-beta-1,6-N-acetylglucosamine synthase-like glycosyltransferase